MYVYGDVCFYVYLWLKYCMLYEGMKRDIIINL